MAESSKQGNNDQRQMIVPRNLGGNLHRLRNAENDFSDVTIQTSDGKQLDAHKVILASASDYFSTMFSTKMRERYADVVEMNDMAPDVLTTVIDFIYDQSIFLTEENIYDLTDAAEYLQVSDLKTECQNFLLSSTKPTNCLKHRFYGQRYNMKPVSTIANEIIADSFEEVSKENEFNKLEFDGLQTVLQLQRNMKSEDIVFSAIVKWTKHDMDGRQKYFDSLFLSIDISLLPDDFIETDVLTETLIQNSSSSVLRISTELMKRIQRQKLHAPSRIGIIGGKDTANDIVMFDVASKQILQVLKLKFDIKYPVAVRNDDKLYVIDELTSDVRSLNIKEPNQKWEEVSKLPQSQRYYVGCAVLNGFLYVAGGQKSGTYFSSLVRYDPTNNEWSDLKSMNNERSQHALVSLAGKLYAIGGSDNTVYYRSVEMYDVGKNEWTAASPLSKGRDEIAAVVFNGEIYTSGGYSNRDVSIVEKYNPIKDEWALIKELNTPRRAHGSCVVGRKLYVVGGTKVKSIEVYDLERDEWEICGELDKERNFSAAYAF